MTIKVLLVLAAIGISTAAFAQSAPPAVGSRPMARVKSKEPIGCRLVGTVRGTKLWAGDCTSSNELMGTTPDTETQSPPAPPTGTIPSGEKQ
jgi:hypothetical protein